MLRFVSLIAHLTVSFNFTPLRNKSMWSIRPRDPVCRWFHPVFDLSQLTDEVLCEIKLTESSTTFQLFHINMLGSARYSDRSIFRQVDIPTGLYSDRSIFRQVDIPTGLYSDRSIFRQVVIPTGLYSDRSIFRQVYIPTGLYSDRSIFRQVVIPTGRYSDMSIFQQVVIPTVP